MKHQNEYVVHGVLPARVHQTVTASSVAAARRQAIQQGAWFYDDQNDAPVSIINIVLKEDK